jgi:hypothetical protein
MPEPHDALTNDRKRHNRRNGKRGLSYLLALIKYKNITPKKKRI